MSETLSLPVLPLDDMVVLPGMVVPVEISAPRSALRSRRRGVGVRAWRREDSDAKPQVLLVPRLGGKYSSVGTLGVIEQIGRLPAASPPRWSAAVPVRIGTGTWPGAALWVEATVLDEPPATARARSWPASTATIATTILQQRGAWQVVDVCRTSPTRRRWPTSPGTPPT